MNIETLVLVCNSPNFILTALALFLMSDIFHFYFVDLHRCLTRNYIYLLRALVFVFLNFKILACSFCLTHGTNFLLESHPTLVMWDTLMKVRITTILKLYHRSRLTLVCFLNYSSCAMFPFLNQSREVISR